MARLWNSSIKILESAKDKQKDKKETEELKRSIQVQEEEKQTKSFMKQPVFINASFILNVMFVGFIGYFHLTSKSPRTQPNTTESPAHTSSSKNATTAVEFTAVELANLLTGAVKESDKKITNLAKEVQQLKTNHTNEMKHLNTTYLKDIGKCMDDLNQSTSTIEKQESIINDKIDEATACWSRIGFIKVSHSHEMEQKEQMIKVMYNTFRDEKIERMRSLQSEYEAAAKRTEKLHAAQLIKVLTEATSTCNATKDLVTPHDSEAAARDNEEDASSLDEAAVVEAEDGDEEQQSSSDLTEVSLSLLCFAHQYSFQTTYL